MAIRVLDHVIPLVIAVPAGIVASTTSWAPLSVVCGVLAYGCILWAAVCSVLLRTYRKVSGQDPRIPGLESMPALGRWVAGRFPSRAASRDRAKTNRDVLDTATTVHGLVDSINATDTLATFQRLSALDGAVDQLGRHGRRLQQLCDIPSIEPEIRRYAHGVLAAYEATLTPAAVCGAIRRFTDAYVASTTKPWTTALYGDPASWGFVEAYLRVHSTTSLDWAVLNEYYLAGSAMFDARSTAHDHGSTRINEFFREWWDTARDERAGTPAVNAVKENLPFDTVLLHLPCSIVTAHGWKLEAEQAQYPLTIAPRTPACSDGAPVEFVAVLWQKTTVWHRRLDRVVSAARKITK